jgi:hypothetical protein
MFRFAPALALAAIACTPHSAELSNAELYGFISATTSLTLIQGTFDPSDVDENWNIDCRVFEDEADEILRLEAPLDICERNAWPPVNEVWLDNAYRGFRMPLDEAWRGEGLILNEGDLQVGFHHRLPGGEDFRFAFSIDPDFQPTQCVPQDDGTVSRELVDGDWIGEWSKDIDWLNEQADGDLPPFLAAAADKNAGGRLFYLNARSFQFDPDSDDPTARQSWSLPEEWRAGFGRGTFVAEDLRSRYNRFGAPEVYILFDQVGGGSIPRDVLYHADCEEGDTIGDCQAYRQLRTEGRDVASAVGRQLGMVTPADTPFYQPIAHTNEWRPIDGKAPGLDAWVELGYSWVMLHPDSNPEKGGSVSGSFSIVLDGNDSLSRFIVQGDFEVPNVKGERWGSPDLRAEKAELAGDQPCAE